MSNFDRKRLLSNIATLTKDKNVRMGDLEAAAGVSAGYFSRLNKGESNAIPNIEVIAAVAEKLEVTIDCLVRVDYETLTPSERYLIDFINKLISKATSFEMLWEGESVKKMLAAGMNQDGCAIHPLFEVRSVNMGTGMSGYPDYEDQVVYNSLFHEGEFLGLLGPSYHIDFDGGSVFWIADVGIEYGEEMAPDEEIELYMQKNYKVIPICHTVANGVSPFNEILFSLYKAAAETSKRPKIDASVKSAIDSFMEDLPF